MTSMARIESALQEGKIPLAEELLTEERNRVESPAQIYYQVIRDGLVATFRHLESSAGRICSESDSFRHCSNAWLELGVKNVKIAKEMEVLVMYKLSSYGLRRLCGNPAKEANKVDWRDSIGRIVQWVEELRQRSKCYDFLDIDDQVMYRVRMIHNHLFFVKDRRELKNHSQMGRKPADLLGAMIFCLAIFARVHNEDPEYYMYRVVINKRNIMQFLIEIALMLKRIVDPGNNLKHPKSRVLKQLSKAYRKLKYMRSAKKIQTTTKIHSVISANDWKRNNASITVSAFKRINQVFGEAIKNTSDSPNFTAKFNDFLSRQLTDLITYHSKFRDASCHGFPFYQLYQREADQSFSYKERFNFFVRATHNISLIDRTILTICHRYYIGMMRRCRTNEELRSLIRFVSSNTSQISNMMESVKDQPFVSRQDFPVAVEIRAQLEDLMNPARPCYLKMIHLEAGVFIDLPFTDMQNDLTENLLRVNSDCIFDLEESVRDRVQKKFPVGGFHYKNELDQELLEQWRYREETQKIFKRFVNHSSLDASTCSELENKLHTALSKGYYQNVFALDSKAQAIKNTLKDFVVGQKNSKDFKKRNNVFKSELATVRHQDEKELKMVFRKIILKLQDVYKRSDCDSIDKLIENHEKIRLKYRLAIEYWQLQAMEILCSSGYFGDNFSLFTRSIPIIWGKSYRNYLAHDSVSYDLLTSSGSLKVLINGFVLAFDSANLNIFSGAPNFNLDGFVSLEVQGFQWLEIQTNLLESMKTQELTCHVQGTEFKGRYLLAPGKLFRPELYDLDLIVSHDRLDCSRITNKFAVQLNLLQFENLPILDAVDQFASLQPALIHPCIGAVSEHIYNTNNPNNKMILETLANRYINFQTNKFGGFNVFSKFNLVVDEPLKCAIIQNNLSQLRELVDDYCNPTNTTINGFNLSKPALSLCCVLGRVEMARYILSSNRPFGDEWMKQCLKYAIDNRRWRIVDLLAENRVRLWLIPDNFDHFLAKRNFKMLRRMLTESLPEDCTERIIRGVVRHGNKRLLRYFVQIGVDIWKCPDVLSTALQNKNADVFEYIEDRFFETDESVCYAEDLKPWIKIFQKMIKLSLLSKDDTFIPGLEKNTEILKRWKNKMLDFAKINTTHYIKSIHFHSPTKRIQFGDMFSKECMECQNLIQGLPKLLDLSKAFFSFMGFSKHPLYSTNYLEDKMHIQINSRSCTVELSMQNELKLPVGLSEELAEPETLEYFKSMCLHCRSIFKPINYYTLLAAPIAEQKYDIVEFSLQKFATTMLPHWTEEKNLLSIPVVRGDLTMVKLLLRYCPRLIDMKCEAFTEDQTQLLGWAVTLNHENIVRILLEAGADLNHRNAKGWTALALAIENEAVESLEVMFVFALRMGVTIDNDVDGRGTTALQFAEQQDVCLEIVRALKDNGHRLQLKAAQTEKY